MGKVRLLDEATVNQIAAGEVVERPASVVKELVENALDAGATRVQVDLAAGGCAGVEVVDDGCGMSPEDLRLAVERHATSKIRSAADLERVASLGFRGEALPSIAAVSRLELVTREPDALAGARLVVRGGQVEEAGEAGCPAGTRAAVTELFFNTPARRKHLKSAAAELDRCLKAVAGLALACPGVTFRVRHNGREVLHAPGTGRLEDAVLALFGREVAEALVPVEGAAGGMRLTGFVALPAAARASRSHQFFIVNGRAAAGFPLAQALEEAYAGLVPRHRHPVAFLRLDLPPEKVDVNVHPAKLRVRFQEEAAVGRLVRAAVGEALARADLTPRAAVRPAAPGPLRGPSPYGAPGGAAPLPLLREAVPGYAAGKAADAAWPEVAAAGPEAAMPVAPGEPEAVAAPAGEGGRWPALRLIGAFDRTYLLAEGEGGLYIIDQHAAHERLNYERFLRLRAAGLAAAQPLAAPVPVRVGPGRLALWEEHRPRIEACGFVAEPFGPDTLLLREVPVLLAGDGHAQAFLDLLDRLEERGPAFLESEGELAWLALRSCKASVKAHDALAPAEQAALLHALAGADNPFTCPHGRPTIVRLSRREMERLFKRA